MSRSAIRACLDALDQDALLASIVARIGEDTGEGSKIAEEYRYEAGFDDDDDVDDDEDADDAGEGEGRDADAGGSVEPDGIDLASPEHAAAFARFVETKAYEELHAALYRLSVSLKVRPDGRIELWRELVVPADWPASGIRERPLGVYWAYAKEAAEAHWGGGAEDGNIRVVVHGLVEPEGIDWAESVVANAAEDATVGEESEVRLLDSAQVEVVGLGLRKEWSRTRDEPIDVGHLAGELLPAGEDAPAPAMGR